MDILGLLKPFNIERYYTDDWGSYTNSIYILVQKNHAKPLWSKGAKNTIGLFYICKWYYSKYIPSHQHQIGKDETWKIERKNLNFRTDYTTPYCLILNNS